VESDRMGYAASAVTEARVDRERAAVANEVRDRTMDASLGVVGLFTMREVFPDWHPYRPLLDNAADLGSIHANDVLAFLHTWYSPANATIAIVGAFDRNSAVAAVHRYFGSIPAGAPPARPVLPASYPPPVRLVIGAAVPHDSVGESWLTPTFGTADDAALDLAAAVLSERLTHWLVTDEVAVFVGARERSMRRASVFTVTVTLAGGGRTAQAETAIQQAIDDIARSLSVEELDRARDVWRRRTLGSLETSWARAEEMIVQSNLGDAMGPSFDWGLHRYAALTVQDVARAVRTWLVRWHRVTTVVLATRGAPQHGVLERRTVAEGL
jgi:predicted Zn-dependent peptidase